MMYRLYLRNHRLWQRVYYRVPPDLKGSTSTPLPSFTQLAAIAVPRWFYAAPMSDIDTHIGEGIRDLNRKLGWVEEVGIG